MLANITPKNDNPLLESRILCVSRKHYVSQFKAMNIRRLPVCL